MENRAVEEKTTRILEFERGEVDKGLTQRRIAFGFGGYKK